MPSVAPTSDAEATPKLKASQPIELLPNDIASIVTHIHPVILLSAFYLRFPALVADPVGTLLSSLVPVAVIQIAYAILCLPATGSTSKPVKKPKLNSSKKTVGQASTKPFVVFFALLLSQLAILPITNIQILMGAPLTTHLPHTFLSSAHISLLVVFPLIYVHGADGGKWREIISMFSPIDEVFGAAVGCMLGAWLGAVPIPLDWDREWQKWPVTIVTGVYAGYVVGKLAGQWVLKGKRIMFD